MKLSIGNTLDIRIRLIKGILILWLLLTNQPVLFADDCFPDKAVSHSPSKTYSIIWQEPSDGETHHLFFDNGKEHKHFFDFIRSVCIHWEPSERYFSLTYNLGSDVSAAYIYKTQGPEKIIDLEDVMPAVVKKLYRNNFHSYINVLSWTDSGLLVRVWGYGDLSPDGFDVQVKCIMNDSKLKCIEVRS